MTSDRKPVATSSRRRGVVVGALASIALIAFVVLVVAAVVLETPQTDEPVPEGPMTEDAVVALFREFVATVNRDVDAAMEMVSVEMVNPISFAHFYGENAFRHAFGTTFEVGDCRAELGSRVRCGVTIIQDGVNVGGGATRIAADAGLLTSVGLPWNQELQSATEQRAKQTDPAAYAAACPDVGFTDEAAGLSRQRREPPGAAFSAPREELADCARFLRAHLPDLAEFAGG